MDNNIIVTNIRDFLSKESIEKLGEEYLENVLSEFSCTKNLGVEHFLKMNAVEFTKKNQSVTYLVFTNDKKLLLGYFTLAIKPVSVNEAVLSKTMIRKIARIGKYDAKKGTYTFSAYLIAQLGKNFHCDNGQMITGDELLELAIEKIKELQYRVGGTVVFLETEENKKLLDFYMQRNNLKQFACRKTSERKDLIQLLKII